MPVYLGLIARGNDRLETVRGGPQVIEFVLYPPAFQSRGSLPPEKPYYFAALVHRDRLKISLDRRRQSLFRPKPKLNVGRVFRTLFAQTKGRL